MEVRAKRQLAEFLRAFFARQQDSNEDERRILTWKLSREWVGYVMWYNRMTLQTTTREWLPPRPFHQLNVPLREWFSSTQWYDIQEWTRIYLFTAIRGATLFNLCTHPLFRLSTSPIGGSARDSRLATSRCISLYRVSMWIEIVEEHPMQTEFYSYDNYSPPINYSARFLLWTYCMAPMSTWFPLYMWIPSICRCRICIQWEVLIRESHGSNNSVIAE